MSMSWSWRIRTALVAGVVSAMTAATASVTAASPTGHDVAGSPTLACDNLDTALCLLPFPNDAFTVADPTTATGRRVDLAEASTPVSQITGGHIDPTAWNRNDGFSPGSPVLTYVPGIDLHQTWGTSNEPHSTAAPNQLGYFDYRDQLADIGRYRRPDAPIVILDAATGQRVPFWSEIDQHPLTAAERTGPGGYTNLGNQLLILRPAVNFVEGHRYIVALRDLKNSAGEDIQASDAFAAYRDGRTDDARTAHMNSLFATLGAAGIARDDLYLTWDFTVASRQSLTSQMLDIRNDAFAQLGDTNLADLRVQGRAPAFTISSVENLDPATNNDTARRVTGSVTVPNYLNTADGRTGSLFNDPNHDGVPDQNGTLQAPFVCDLPKSAVDGGPRARPLLYGHGLLGSPSEVNGGSGLQMRLRGYVTCATPWIGMAADDQGTVVGLMTDISGFETVADRSQQGFLNFMYVGRALVHHDGFATSAAFQVQRGKGRRTPAIRTAPPGGVSPLAYDGNSQGAIMGGAYMALTPDAQRGVLGVAGMNYSTLLNRSVDFEENPYLAGTLYTAYPDPKEQQLVFVLLQMLWDRAEADGYAAHMTSDPLPNTPQHQILMHVAIGDHQVANVSAEVEARTIGARLMVPALMPGKHWEENPYFTPTATYPYRGSAMVYWDSGNATPPNGNVPANNGADPHENPRRDPAGAYQKARFLQNGLVVDVCDGRPYLTSLNPLADGQQYCTSYPPAPAH